jgi:hypothetical protein
MLYIGGSIFKKFLKKMTNYLKKIREIGEKLETALFRALFNPYYDPRNKVSSSRRIGFDFRKRENPLATSFLGRDYLLREGSLEIKT